MWVHLTYWKQNLFLGVYEMELYNKVPEIVDTPKNNMAFEYIEDHGNGAVERAQN